MNRLIALYSPAPQSGKSTVATHLQHHGFTIVSFARPIKAMVAALLEYQGVDAEAVYEAVFGELKEVPMDELGGQTPRYAMQHLGTKWGRDTMGREFWAGIARRRIEIELKSGRGVVIDDMRFPNEFEMVGRLGGRTVKIVRPGASHSSGHPSEGALDDYPFDRTIHNIGSLDQLFDMADMLARGIDHADARSRYVGGKGAGEE